MPIIVAWLASITATRKRQVLRTDLAKAMFIKLFNGVAQANSYGMFRPALVTCIQDPCQDHHNLMVVSMLRTLLSMSLQAGK